MASGKKAKPSYVYAIIGISLVLFLLGPAAIGLHDRIEIVVLGANTPSEHDIAWDRGGGPAGAGPLGTAPTWTGS